MNKTMEQDTHIPDGDDREGSTEAYRGRLGDDLYAPVLTLVPERGN